MKSSGRGRRRRRKREASPLTRAAVLQKKIIAVLFVVVLLSSLAAILTSTTTGKELVNRFRKKQTVVLDVPTVRGLSVSDPVECLLPTGDHAAAGIITKFTVLSNGVRIWIALPPGVSVSKGSSASLSLNFPPRNSSLTIPVIRVSPIQNTPVAVSCNILVRPSKHLLEPGPVWEDAILNRHSVSTLENLPSANANSIQTRQLSRRFSPSQIDTTLLLAYRYQQTQHPGDALNLLQPLTNLTFDTLTQTRILYGAAVCAAQLGLLQKADNFLKLLPTPPQEKFTRPISFLRSLVNLQLDRPEQALESLGIPRKNDFPGQLLRANAFARLGQFREASELYRSLHELSPAADYNLALVLEKKGDIVESIRTLKDVGRDWPDFAQAHYQLGILLDENRDYTDAREEFQKAIDLEQNAALIRWYKKRLSQLPD